LIWSGADGRQRVFRRSGLDQQVGGSPLFGFPWNDRIGIIADFFHDDPDFAGFFFAEANRGFVTASERDGKDQ
jgi:hypothetical protein